MRAIAAVWMTFLLASVGIASEPKLRESRLGMTWQLDLSADGSIERLELRGTWPDELRTRLEGDIRNWRFKPGEIDGSPAPTRTFLHLRLHIRSAKDEAWNVRIESASTGAWIRDQKRAIYPAMAARGGREGLVLLQVDYDAQGRVTAARVAPASPIQRGSLVGAARAATRQFEFVPEHVGERPIAASAVLPVCFVATRRTDPCTWKQPGSDEKLDEGRALAFESRAGIVTEVAGREL